MFIPWMSQHAPNNCHYWFISFFRQFSKQLWQLTFSRLCLSSVYGRLKVPKLMFSGLTICFGAFVLISRSIIEWSNLIICGGLYAIHYCGPKVREATSWMSSSFHATTEIIYCTTVSLKQYQSTPERYRWRWSMTYNDHLRQPRF